MNVGPNHPTKPRMAAARLRENRAYELLAAGVPMEKIAEELGYADAGGVWKAIQRAMRRYPSVKVEEYRQLQGAQLADLLGRAYRIAIRAQPVVHNGQVVMYDEPEEQPDGTTRMRRRVLIDPMPQLQAISTIVKIQERQAKLYGMDAPQEVNLGGTIEVKEADTEQMISRVREMRQRRAIDAGSVAIDAPSTNGHSTQPD